MDGGEDLTGRLMSRFVRRIPDVWNMSGEFKQLREVQLLMSGLYEAVWVLRN